MAKTEMKIAVNETAMIARTVSPLMERQADSGPTDFSLNAAVSVVRDFETGGILI